MLSFCFFDLFNIIESQYATKRAKNNHLSEQISLRFDFRLQRRS